MLTWMLPDRRARPASIVIATDETLVQKGAREGIGEVAMKVEEFTLPDSTKQWQREINR